MGAIGNHYHFVKGQRSAMKTAAGVFMILVSLQVCSAAFGSEPIRLSSTIHPQLSQPGLIAGRGNGVMYDLTFAAFRAVNYDVTIEFLPMARVVWSLFEGGYSANLGVMEWFARENMDQSVEMVDLIAVKIKFFYKKEKFPDGLSFEHLSDLKAYKIGSVRGSSTLPILQQAGIEAELVTQIEQNFKKMNTGRIDLTVAVDLSGWMILNELYPDAVDAFSMIEQPLLSLQAGLIFHKKDSQMQQTFKKGLGIILDNGTFYAIVQKYYGENYKFEDVLPEDIFIKMKLPEKR